MSIGWRYFLLPTVILFHIGLPTITCKDVSLKTERVIDELLKKASEQDTKFDTVTTEYDRRLEAVTAEYDKKLEALSADQKATRELLGKALIALRLISSTDTKQSTVSNGGDDEHVIRRRSDSDDSHFDVHSLSLNEIIPLMSSMCKDGKSGVNGRDGRDGKDGIGKDGRDGINGKDGINGRDGKDGRDGLQGSPGTDGNDGSRGLQGPPGQPGDQGAQGNSSNGQPGRDGTPGVAGPPGPPGTPGNNGLAGTHGSPGAAGRPGNSSNTGAVYTRWGRTSCESDATRLYQGVAAGGHYDNTGGGVDFQCLHLQPEYNSYYTSSGQFSVISGAEYETFPNYGLFPSAAHDQNVPCARCYTQRSAVVMIPSRRSCPSGWTKEYEGYLMTGDNGHTHPMTYECVDQHPEYIAGQRANTSGALLYFVIPDCSGDGTIGHCPPYASNKQLTCVVCSK